MVKHRVNYEITIRGHVDNLPIHVPVLKRLNQLYLKYIRLKNYYIGTVNERQYSLEYFMKNYLGRLSNRMILKKAKNIHHINANGFPKYHSIFIYTYYFRTKHCLLEKLFFTLKIIT